MHVIEGVKNARQDDPVQTEFKPKRALRLFLIVGAIAAAVIVSSIGIGRRLHDKRLEAKNAAFWEMRRAKEEDQAQFEQFQRKRRSEARTAIREWERGKSNELAALFGRSNINTGVNSAFTEDDSTVKVTVSCMEIAWETARLIAHDVASDVDLRVILDQAGMKAQVKVTYYESLERMKQRTLTASTDKPWGS